MKTRRLRVGEWVEVRSREEILSTLDGKGQLGGMPFMPEMFAFCGKKFQVYKRAHKTCDTVFPVRGRRVDRALHLTTRCGGEEHGGCQAGCLIFWKEAWLKRCRKDSGDTFVDATRNVGKGVAGTSATGCADSVVYLNVQRSSPRDEAPAYVCQATQLPYATTPLAWWDLRQYIEDYWSGNVGWRRILGGLVYSMYYNLSEAGIGVGPAMRWFYDLLHPLRRGRFFPRKRGAIREGQPTPAATLDLQPGEVVRVKSHEAILKTLNTDSKNRGLYWDAEMVPYCGGTYRVLKRVTRIINEKTGKMEEMKSSCIILASVVCESRYSTCRMFCPRSIYPLWREIWLERVSPDGDREVGL